MAYSYQPFEKGVAPQPDMSAFDPYAVRSSGAFPEDFPAGMDFSGIIIDENIPPYNIFAQRPIRDVQVKSGLAVRRGQSLGEFSSNVTMVLAGVVIGFLLFRKK